MKKVGHHKIQRLDTVMIRKDMHGCGGPHFGQEILS